MKEPDGSWVVVNRLYKPLGFTNSRDWVTYADHPITVRFKRLTQETMEKLSWQPLAADADRIYLYNDGCVPTESASNLTAYLERLAVLMRLQLQD